MSMPMRPLHALLRALAAAALLAAGGCAAPPGERGGAGDEQRIVEVASGRSVTRAEVLAAIRASDYALLGEQHDNPHHHRVRGELLAALDAPRAVVVAEHLPSGSRVAFGPDLLQSLTAAGFDAKGWRWPLHEPLFAAIARAGLPLIGGNVSRETARNVARSGASALPAPLAAEIAAAPLNASAQAALDEDLVRGHCGQVSASQLGGVGTAQRARDASMWLALRDSGGKPAILVAGNGHVRLDYGVPQLIAQRQPGARIVSVGFAEFGSEQEKRAGEATPYTYLWFTARAERTDPCAGFTMPKR